VRQILKMGRMGIFLAKSLSCCASPPIKVPLILKQIQFIGYQSLLVIFLTGAFTGMVLGYQGFNTLSRFGSDAFLGPMVGLALIKEMGPVISALMVTGRAGSSITAEIGIMRISEQIDALQLMGLNLIAISWLPISLQPSSRFRCSRPFLTWWASSAGT